MDIKLNGKKSKYLELYEILSGKINSGELKVNEKLPSKRNLAMDLNVSLNTVIGAYDLLMEEGYIYAKEKLGYYVSEQLAIEHKPVRALPEEKKEIRYPYDFTTRNVAEFTNTNYKRIIRNLIHGNEYLDKCELQGNIGLRIAISNHLKLNRGIDASPSRIYIGSGIESLRSVLRITDIDNITLENPGYHKLDTLAKNLGLNVNYIDLDSQGVKIPDKKTILYTTPFNQFPTGIKMSVTRKKELIQFLNQTESYLIEDDFDSEFRIKDAPTTSIYSLSSERVIFFSTFTMTMYPGIRIAYFILPEDLSLKYNEHYQGYSSNISTLEQLALRDFINEGYYASHINKLKKSYIEKRNLITSLLKENNISFDEKKNYLSILVNTGKNTDNLISELKKKGVNITPLKFYDKENKEDGILVLGYTSIPYDSISDGLKILINALKKRH